MEIASIFSKEPLLQDSSLICWVAMFSSLIFHQMKEREREVDEVEVMVARFSSSGSLIGAPR